MNGQACKVRPEIVNVFFFSVKYHATKTDITNNNERGLLKYLNN